MKARSRRADENGPGGSSKHVLEGGTQASVGLMQIQPHSALPEIDFLAGIAEVPDEEKSVYNK
jgi:hypothetical protein